MAYSGKQRKRPFWRWSNGVILGLTLLAFALYLYQLDGQSIWRDEALSIARARQPLSLLLANRNVVQGVESPDLHPPFYFLLLRGWRTLAGESEFALRFPSLVAAVLSIALLGRVGRRIWGRETGLWAAALATLSPFYLWYAQEIRMYALLVWESLLLLYALWPLLQAKAPPRNYVWFGLVAAVTVYTHYTGVFLVGFAVLAILVARLRFSHRARWGWWRIVAVLVGLAILAIPLYPSAWELLTAHGFIAFTERRPWKILYEAVNTFSLGSAVPLADPGWRLTPFVLLALFGSLTFHVRPPRRRWRAALIGAGGLVITLALFYLASLLQLNYSNPRHLTMLSAFWFLLMGHGLTTLRRGAWPLAVAVGAVALVAGSMALWQTMTDPPMVRDDVRSLAAYIGERAQPGDAVVWHNAVMSLVYDYYASDLPYTAIPRYGQRDEGQALERLAEWSQSYQRIWFISSPSPPFFNQELIPEALSAQWVRVKEAIFPASWTLLTLRLYRPLHPAASLPPHAHPADLQQGSYHIQGVVAEPAVAAGQGTWLSLFWQLTGEPAAEPPVVCLRLRDSADTLWRDGCTPLALPQGQAIPPDSLIEQQVWLPLPVGLAPVPYTLELFFGDATQDVGTLQVQRPSAPPELKPLARYENGLELVAASWADEAFRAGQWVLGDLVWRAQSALQSNMTAQLRVVDWLGRVVAEDEISLGPPDYRAQQWQAGDVVRRKLSIRLPYRIEGYHRVHVSVLDGNGEPVPREGLLPAGRWASLGWIYIRDWPFVSRLPEGISPPPQDVYFGDGAIQLAGYDLTRDASELKLDLYWRSRRELDENYGVFIHVGRAGEPPLVQAGGVDWTRPVESWREGEIVTTSHTVELPVDLPQQGLSLWIGLYDPERPEVRLPLTVGGEPAPDNRLNLGPFP